MIGALCTAPRLREAPEPQTPTFLGEERRLTELLELANDPIGIQRFAAQFGASLEDQLANTFVRALYLVREHTRDLSAGRANELVEQLGELLSIECWDEDDELLKIASLRTMIDVIITLDRGVGGLTVAANGNLVATWSADDHVLRVEASSGGEVAWTSLHPRGAQPRHQHEPQDTIENLRAVAVALLGDAGGHPKRR